MEPQSSIKITNKLKTELKRRILKKPENYDGFIRSLLHLLDAYMDMRPKYSKQMEVLRKSAHRRSRAFLKKEREKKKHLA